LLKFCIKFLYFQAFFQCAQHLYEKRKGSGSKPLTNDPDPEGPKTCGSRSTTQEKLSLLLDVLIFLVFFFSQTARLSSFVGAMAIGDLIKSTLGPKGMDKILWGTGRNEGVVEVSLMETVNFLYIF
jgi:hypothetical protein